jgi:hypothetical protein
MIVDGSDSPPKCQIATVAPTAGRARVGLIASDPRRRPG